MCDKPPSSDHEDDDNNKPSTPTTATQRPETSIGRTAKRSHQQQPEFQPAGQGGCCAGGQHDRRPTKKSRKTAIHRKRSLAGPQDHAVPQPPPHQPQNGRSRRGNNTVELKRLREQKRRASFSEKFAELTSLLGEIDPAFRATTTTTSSPNTGVPAAAAAAAAQPGVAAAAGGDNKNNVSSATAFARVDIIDHAITLLRQIHDENEARKRVIAQVLADQNNSSISSSVLTSSARHQILPPTHHDLISSLLVHAAAERATTLGSSQVEPPPDISTGPGVRISISMMRCHVCTS
jgi:hypothetical protein